MEGWIAATYPSQAPPATTPAVPGGPLRRPTSTALGAGRGAGSGDGGGSGPVKNLRKRIGSVFAGLIALIAKFGAALKALLVALPNAQAAHAPGAPRWYRSPRTACSGAGSSPPGFVVLLFVHEMGHVIALRREGIKASAPMFIPFLGAVIIAKSLGEDALAEARVGLAGPILGTLAAAAVAVVGELTGSSLPARAGLRGLPDQPLQPAARRAARRRPGDGGDGTVDVVPRLRRAGRAGVHVPQLRSC